MAPSVRGLPPQAGGGESLALYEVSDEDAFLSLSPLRGQLPHRGSPVRQKTPILPCRECRGEQCSPANLAQQRFFRENFSYGKWARAHTVRPYTALIRQSELSHRGSLLCSGKLYIPAYSKGPPYCGRAFRAGVRNRKRRMALLKCALRGRKPIWRGDHWSPAGGQCPPLQGGGKQTAYSV